MENVISNPSLKENNLFKDSYIAKVQKIIWWVMLLVFALLCVYALVMSTPISNLMFADETYKVNGVTHNYADMLTEMKPLNDAIILFGIFGILFAFGYKISRSNVRGKYYISNFVYMIVQSVYTLVAGVVSLIIVIKYQTMFNALKFDKINDILSFTKPGTSMSPSDITGMAIFGYILAVVIILVTILNVYVLVAKFLKQKNEPNIEETATADAKLAE